MILGGSKIMIAFIGLIVFAVLMNIFGGSGKQPARYIVNRNGLIKRVL
jgi:hypothetical protein